MAILEDPVQVNRIIETFENAGLISSVEMLKERLETISLSTSSVDIIDIEEMKELQGQLLALAEDIEIFTKHLYGECGISSSYANFLTHSILSNINTMINQFEVLLDPDFEIKIKHQFLSIILLNMRTCMNLLQFRVDFLHNSVVKTGLGIILESIKKCFMNEVRINIDFVGSGNICIDTDKVDLSTLFSLLEDLAAGNPKKYAHTYFEKADNRGMRNRLGKLVEKARTPRVRITGKYISPNQIELTFRDNGRGIEAEDVLKLNAGKLERANKDPKIKGKGTTYRTLREFKIPYTISSHGLGRGSEVSVILPILLVEN